jgi:CheY-like chemotaxis protein/RimJ/RimL family protein N-acetyltransferase
MHYWFEEPYEAFVELCDLYDKHIHDQSERRFIVERDRVNVGLVELVEINHIHRRAEFQIIIAPAHQGNHYASIATRLAMDYAFTVLNLYKLSLIVDCETCGPSAFTARLPRGGPLRHEFFVDSEYRDVFRMAIFQPEYLALRQRPEPPAPRAAGAFAAAWLNPPHDRPAESAPSSREPAWADYAVLVVDDEAGVRNFLQRALQARGCRVDIAGSAEEGAERLVEHHFDAIVLDIALPGRSGMDWLRSLKNGGFAGDVILITAFADIETAIDALRAGASDFVLKPFRVDQIVNSLQRCFERARLDRENFVLQRQVAGLGGQVEGLVGHSGPMCRLSDLIRRVAPTPPRC